MKLFLVAVLALLALVHADGEWKPKVSAEIREIHKECLKEHPLSEDALAKLRNFVYPDEEPVRQYLMCSAVKIGTFNTHDGYSADRLAKQYKLDANESEVLAIAQGCLDKNEQGSAADVWSFRVLKCFMESKVGDNLKAYIKKRREEAAKSA